MKPKENNMFLVKDVPVGRLNALVKKLGGLEVMDGILNDTVKFTLVEAPVPSVLSPFQAFSTTITETRDPGNFFCDRSRLYVWGDYRYRIVSKAKSVETDVVITAKWANLEQDAADKEIGLALGEGHIWEESTLCAFVAQHISEQEGGRGGMLLNNGFANIFYTTSCVVVVGWGAGGRGWGVGAWGRGGGGWSAGGRVFSPAT